MLTDRYLDGVPADSRASRGGSLSTDLLTDEALEHIRSLNEIAKGRGQSLAQMALAWALRDERVTSVLVGASSVRQLEDNLATLQNLEFDDARVDHHRGARRRLRHQPLAAIQLRLGPNPPAVARIIFARAAELGYFRSLQSQTAQLPSRRA